ncbi:MAG: hypothetical protein M3O22_00660 [Pseudomonadota bacterium]|nr:hypothetical protein [Pseudomonadota bacterium]
MLTFSEVEKAREATQGTGQWELPEPDISIAQLFALELWVRAARKFIQDGISNEVLKNVVLRELIRGLVLHTKERINPENLEALNDLRRATGPAFKSHFCAAVKSMPYNEDSDNNFSLLFMRLEHDQELAEAFDRQKISGIAKNSVLFFLEKKLAMQLI